MRFTIIASALLSLAAVVKAQDASCTAVLNDFTIASSSGAYQKCYTERVYNAELIAGGGNPNYTEIINNVCGNSACSPSTLKSATTKYLTACNASLTTEATNSGGNILQLGQNALEIFFAEPIRNAYCAIDPNVKVPAPPVVVPPTYCLASATANPSNSFTGQLAYYLTSGSIRSTQTPFFATATIDPKDICSDCSQLSVSATIDFLSKNAMPSISNFYTPEFVQYWTKFVPAYNTFCKTSLTQTWPEGTLNTTVPGVPTGNPTTAIPSPTANATTPATSTPTGTSGAGAMKPAFGVASAMLLAVVGLF
ncbi:hypothetical protein BGZ76_001567 [Entomortierella beljakovae]|nr:hypothetical protein BGZ76_001567 [Entomortierella beljakovae]